MPGCSVTMNEFVTWLIYKLHHQVLSQNYHQHYVHQIQDQENYPHMYLFCIYTCFHSGSCFTLIVYQPSSLFWISWIVRRLFSQISKMYISRTNWVKPAKFFFKQCLDNSGLQIANFSQMQSCCLPDFVVLQRESIFGLLGGLIVTMKISFHCAKIMEKFRAMIKQNIKALLFLYLKS